MAAISRATNRHSDSPSSSMNTPSGVRAHDRRTDRDAAVRHVVQRHAESRVQVVEVMIRWSIGDLDCAGPQGTSEGSICSQNWPERASDEHFRPYRPC